MRHMCVPVTDGLLETWRGPWRAKDSGSLYNPRHIRGMRASARLALALLTAASLDAAPQRDAPANPGGERAARPMTYVEARPIVERVAPELATRLAARPETERETAWQAWRSERDAAIRARLERGEEDSLVNLLRFGT